MSSAWSDVLEIAAVGSVQLFGYLTGLVALMYGLTSPALQQLLEPSRPGASPPSGPATDPAGGSDAAEADRRRRAVALAVATARASIGGAAASPDGGSRWREAQRARRFGQPRRREKGRS